MLNIEYSWQLKKSDLINISHYEKIIAYNCIVLKEESDKVFNKGIVVYLQGSKKRVLDLGNNNGLYVQKVY